jgi:hypothetical protein
MYDFNILASSVANKYLAILREILNFKVTIKVNQQRTLYEYDAP